MAVVIAIDPHGDDLALFGAFLCLRYKPVVIVTHLSVPKQEVEEAMVILGCNWECRSLENVPWINDDLIIAPAWERDGLSEHNQVARMVNQRVPQAIRYMTYAGHPRQKSRSSNEVEFKPEWLFAKHRALAAFESQATTPSWMHFVEDLREYVA